MTNANRIYMKNRLFFLSSVAIFLGAYSHAQTIAIGGTVGYQLPMGDLSGYYTPGFGLSVSGHYMLQENISVGGSIGYYSLTGLKDGFSDDYKISFIPIVGDIKFYLMPRPFRPFVGIDAGIYETKEVLTFDTYAYTNLGLAPTVGFFYALTDQVDLTANLKYNAVLNSDNPAPYLGLNAGVFLNIPR